MADTITLVAQMRTLTGRKVRTDEEPRIPAVIYGRKEENKNIWVDTTPFLRTLQDAGESTVINLTVDKKAHNVLIHDYQINPVSDEIIHIDFFQVRMDEAVTTDVPLVFVGESEAVKTLGGTLTTVDVVSVRALPGDLPHNIEIDISSLATFDDTLSITDIDLGEKVEVLTSDDLVVASVAAPRTQEEVDAADEEVDADVSQVEGVADKDEEGEDVAAEEKKEESDEKK